MEGLYVPTYPSDPQELESEITFVNTLLITLDPTDANFNYMKWYYDQQLQGLQAKAMQYGTPTYPQFPGASPGESSASGSGSVSRKRSRDSSPGGTPETPMSIQYPPANEEAPVIHNPVPGPNYIDLTMLDVDEVLAPPNVPLPDPFPELANAYLPGASQAIPTTSQPADAFNQEWMSQEELAQFLIAPTPAGGGYAYTQVEPLVAGSAAAPAQAPALGAFNAIEPRHVNLEEQLFGDWSTPMEAESSEAVQDLIENIQDHEGLQPEEREPTPNAMSSKLMEHQKIALTWLLKIERGKSKGGILADEMGLGKTVEALSLILANPSVDPRCKTTLIIAPVALMKQWEKELERHVKPHHQLSVYTYHGYKKNADFSKLRKYDVVLTTFGTLSSEMKSKDNRQEAEAAQREQQDSRYVRPARETLALLGRDSLWYRVIIDEAQCIKNRNTRVSKAAHDLQSQNRLCMTGTPMMNSIEELYPLIRFLRIAPYHIWSRFNFDISRPAQNRSDHMRSRAMNRVQALLKSIMLRRGKTTVVDGKQICQIPPKHVNHQAVEFSDAELELYKAIETNSQLKFNRYLKRGTVNNNYASVLVMLLRLRQVCCHPHLIKDLGVQVSTESIAEDDLLTRAGSLKEDVVKRLLEADAFECPICFEVDLNPTIIIPCGHTTCGECFQKLIDPTRGIREGDENSAAKCPHCRGPLSSARITDYKHFCKVHCPEKLASEGEDPEDANGSDVESESESEDSIWEDDNLDDFVVPDGAGDDYEPPKRHDAVVKSEGVPQSKKSKGKGKMKAKETVTLAQLKKESLRNKAAKKKYLKRLRKTFTSSAKIDKTVELLSDIQANDPTEKTLIFSQFTSLLDLLEVPLSEKKFKYQRYDGSMRMNDRADAVNRFMDSAEENIMLISLKAGNAGLNLNKASQVIILDPFWNPFIEDQAVDRAHRMPQKREVHVHRVLVPETVEDRICALQDKKRDIINTALDENAGKSLTRLSVGELQYLFGLRERM